MSRGKFFLLVLPVLLITISIGKQGNFFDFVRQAGQEEIAQLYLPEANFLLNPINQLLAKQPTGDETLTLTLAGNRATELYGLIELDLQTNIQVTNPYDPNELGLKARFTAPSGKVAEVGAFWYQGYDLQTRKPTGKPGWKVRFTPNEAGEWKITAYDPTSGVRSETLTISVNPSDLLGFVRINPQDHRYLAFDNGDFFFPIGVNMAWWSDWKDPIDQYTRWLDEFASNGGNTIRVWMAAWSFGIEWKDTGLGDYTERQYEAWCLDRLFELADQYQIKIILVLMNHGPLSLVANSEWNSNPYNASLGGPLSSPEEFVTNPVATAYYQRRLEYIINRWGYSPNLLAWEWFNEVDLTPITDNALIPWIRQMTAYLQQRDVNHHLVTNSFSVRKWSPVWKLPELDIVQVHEYASQFNLGERDPTTQLGKVYEDLAQRVASKPILLGEFGYSASQRGENAEKTGIQLHNGIWASTFSGYAGSGMYWWWDTYIAPNDLWHHFKGLADFLKGEDLTDYDPFSQLQIKDLSGTSNQAEGLGLRGKETLVWLHSREYTADSAIAARKANPNLSSYTPVTLQGLFLVLNNVVNGNYTVQWFDPQNAAWVEAQQVTAVGHILTIPIPPFNADMAAKILLNP